VLEFVAEVSNWLMPRICTCCNFYSHNASLDLCDSCKKHLPWLNLRCDSCGLVLDSSQRRRCDTCRSQPPGFDSLFALFEYAPPLTKLINQLKFSKKLNLGNLLGTLLAEAATQQWYLKKSLPEVIIPVPLHEKRLRQRGYNQALEISRPVSKLLQIPIDTDFCKRIKYTRQQTRLDKAQRINNLDHAFIINSPINYKYVAIIDDVVTTGSTVRALSIALRAAGVETIDIWCVCRA
jgi:ComF family protein